MLKNSKWNLDLEDSSIYLEETPLQRYGFIYKGEHKQNYINIETCLYYLIIRIIQHSNLQKFDPIPLIRKIMKLKENLVFDNKLSDIDENVIAQARKDL